ncbi:polyphosphate kinase 2 family protein [Stenoxybacter acetivorans]|uniref:polyphosphate kinase 2 family protein n=1 Tax=Stenoxybacter acetivorans TaxID=422441 RepID=UPI00056A3B44|nr:polyphosphate kinase 2 family protein [Stenoxybacter acetivorans]
MSSAEKAYRISAQKNFKLNDIDTKDKSLVSAGKEEREAYISQTAPLLDELQNRLYAENKNKVLVVLQGMDTAGKDGTIRKVFQSIDPLGVRVQAFKSPTVIESAHDYLWRVHQVVPQAGELVIFNRSHYEDVLITRVRGWIDEAECRRRLEHINDFERLLTETGTTVIKFFLHISKEEQRERLQKRLDDPAKNWKFNPADLEDRKLWAQYQSQYETVIATTSTKYAPWYVIPADSKSTRNQLILDILINRLTALNMQYPVVDTTGWPNIVE